MTNNPTPQPSPAARDSQSTGPAHIRRRGSHLEQEAGIVMVDFDYVIVGAGAAGCVLANRLSQDPKNQVLLLEYGGRDKNPMLYVPKGFYFTLRRQRYTYHYSTRPVGPAGRVE